MNNWTAWCTQNVLLTVFCRPVGAATARAMIDRAAFSLEAFLAEYGEDGGCEEGPLYYRHAALCLYGALRILDAVAPGRFALLLRTPKVRNIADYNVHVGGWSWGKSRHMRARGLRNRTCSWGASAGRWRGTAASRSR